MPSFPTRRSSDLSMDQEVPASAGRASFRATLRAIPVPLLVTDRKSTLLNSSHRTTSYAVFCTKMAAPRTSTEAEAVSDPSLVVVTLAVLSTGEEPAVAAVVGEERCTV